MNKLGWSLIGIGVTGALAAGWMLEGRYLVEGGRAPWAVINARHDVLAQALSAGVSDEEKQDALSRAVQRKDFAALARQHSQDPGSAVNGGDLGFFEQRRMVVPFNDVAFSLKPGATSDLVETQFGYHIIRVAEKHPARIVPLEEVRPRLEEYLQHRNRESETESFVKGLRTKSKVEILV